MQSPVTSGFCRSVLDIITAWHILEIKQNLAQQSSERKASLTNQLVVERLQRYSSNILQGSGSPKVLTIVLEQFTNIMLVMLMLVALVSTESKDLLSNTIADCGYTLQDGVASLFPSSGEALRTLSVVMFVWLGLKKSFTSVVLLLKD